MFTLHGKLALVTGAASGIGQAMACELARLGADVLLVDLEADGLHATARQVIALGRAAHVHLADLAQAVEVAALAARVHTEFGRLDILVNNAGVAYYGTTHEMANWQWQRVLAVNLQAPVQLTRALLPLLSAQVESRVLNVSSIAGIVGVARLAAYNTTKFALIGFSESLRAEYSSRGIGVTVVCPGLVRTGIFEHALTGGVKSAPRFPGWLQASPEYVARRSVRAMQKNRGLVIVTPPALGIWWIKRLAPGFFDWLQRFRRAPAKPNEPLRLADEPWHESRRAG